MSDDLANQCKNNQSKMSDDLANQMGALGVEDRIEDRIEVLISKFSVSEKIGEPEVAAATEAARIVLLEASKAGEVQLITVIKDCQIMIDGMNHFQTEYFFKFDPAVKRVTDVFRPSLINRVLRPFVEKHLPAVTKENAELHARLENMEKEAIKVINQKDSIIGEQTIELTKKDDEIETLRKDLEELKAAKSHRRELFPTEATTKNEETNTTPLRQEVQFSEEEASILMGTEVEVAQDQLEDNTSQITGQSNDLQGLATTFTTQLTSSMENMFKEALAATPGSKAKLRDSLATPRSNTTRKQH